MIKRISLVNRKKGLSREAFAEHWLGPHAELALRLPRLRGYRINLTAPGAQWDGIAEVWFDSREDCDAAFAALADEFSVDRPKFLAEGQVVLFVEEHVVLDETAQRVT